MDLISILLPVYHGEEYLPQALQSIQEQSYPHWELLACIDGIDDLSDLNHKCREILEASQKSDPRIRILTLEKQGGIEGAMNHALQHAQGKYITRLDQDDRMHPERLSKQLAFAKRQSSPFFLGTSIALIGTLTEGQKYFINWQNAQQNHQEMILGLYRDSTLSHPSLFTETTTLQKLGGYHVNPWAEDLDLYFRASQQGVTFAKLAEPLTYKRLSENQLSKTSVKCKRPALMQAKAHYLKSDPNYQGKSDFYILGTGPTATQVFEGLEQAGITTLGFIEHKFVADKKDLRKKEVQGIPVLLLRELLETKNAKRLILGAIGHQSTQEELKQQFQASGLGPQEILWMI